MSQPLVLSLFPGIGLLDMAFEEEGFSVVRGPDVLWGGEIRRFHPPAGVFEGVIGGPPCQLFSTLQKLNAAQGHKAPENLIPEFERCVGEATPTWWVMENVRRAPEPCVHGYIVQHLLLNNRWLGAEQSRLRRFSFGSRNLCGFVPDVALFEAPIPHVPAVTSGTGFPSATRLKRQYPQAVTAAHGGMGSKTLIRYTVEEAARLQGLPDDFLSDAPFTAAGKLKAIANGVPLPMGRAIARAVKRAMGYEAAA